MKMRAKSSRVLKKVKRAATSPKRVLEKAYFGRVFRKSAAAEMGMSKTAVERLSEYTHRKPWVVLDAMVASRQFLTRPMQRMKFRPDPKKPEFVDVNLDELVPTEFIDDAYEDEARGVVDKWNKKFSDLPDADVGVRIAHIPYRGYYAFLFLDHKGNLVVPLFKPPPEKMVNDLSLSLASRGSFSEQGTRFAATLTTT
jgi:hypothetical protein